MDKLFSIVIPVFNGERYIDETLKSIFSQTYKCYEIIVVDGGSNDNTLKILGNYRERLKAIISEKDNGMYDALNKGFRIAQGDYFCYINSDDRLLPHALKCVAQKFNEGQFDFVFGDVNYISSDGDVIYSYKAKNLSCHAIRALQRLPFAQQSSFWTNDIHKRVGGFDCSLKYVADSKFFFKICLNPNTRKGYINKPLGEFRLHEGSMSIAQSEKMKFEDRKMKMELKLKRNDFRRLWYELMLKTINRRDIYKKLKYKGVKL